MTKIIIYIYFSILPLIIFAADTSTPPTELGLLLLQEKFFQDSLRNNDTETLKQIVSEMDSNINILVKKGAALKLTNTVLKIVEKYVELEDILKNSKSNNKTIETAYNNFVDSLYKMYKKFPLKDSPEVNFFFIDIFQLETYIDSNEFNNMLIEIKEMQTFSKVIINEFKENNFINPRIKFLFKYFNILLNKIEWAVLDGDTKTLNTLFAGLKELISEFQTIYIENKKPV